MNCAFVAFNSEIWTFIELLFILSDDIWLFYVKYLTKGENKFYIKFIYGFKKVSDFLIYILKEELSKQRIYDTKKASQ